MYQVLFNSRLSSNNPPIFVHGRSEYSHIPSFTDCVHSNGSANSIQGV